MAGKVVMLTQNGFPRASCLRCWMAIRRAEGLGWDKAVMLPRPPERDTAAAKGGTPTHCIAAMIMGLFDQVYKMVSVLRG